MEALGLVEIGEVILCPSGQVILMVSIPLIVEPELLLECEVQLEKLVVQLRVTLRRKEWWISSLKNRTVKGRQP